MHSIVAARSLALASTALECWPQGAIHTSDDVIVNGSSLAHAARAQPTPAVRIGAAGGLWADRTAPQQRFVTVVLTRVEEVTVDANRHRLQIWVDAELDHCRAIYSAARIVGRAGSSRRKRMQLWPHSLDTEGWVRLPADITAGDLIALPCDGAVPIGEVRGRDRRREHGQLPDEPSGASSTNGLEGEFREGPLCLK